jgi:hypothetical protein
MNVEREELVERRNKALVSDCLYDDDDDDDGADHTHLLYLVIVPPSDERRCDETRWLLGIHAIGMLYWIRILALGGV